MSFTLYCTTIEKTKTPQCREVQRLFEEQGKKEKKVHMRCISWGVTIPIAPPLCTRSQHFLNLESKGLNCSTSLQAKHDERKSEYNKSKAPTASEGPTMHLFWPLLSD